MDIYIKKQLNGSFIPCYASDLEQAKKLKVGDEFKAKITKPRNYQFHKKYFALLNMAFENQELYDNFEDFRLIYQMKAGFRKEIKTEKGTAYIPVSISFASMDEFDFQMVYSKVFDQLWKHIFMGIDKEEIESNVLNFM